MIFDKDATAIQQRIVFSINGAETIVLKINCKSLCIEEHKFKMYRQKADRKAKRN